jgi:hypothetical protein
VRRIAWLAAALVVACSSGARKDAPPQRADRKDLPTSDAAADPAVAEPAASGKADTQLSWQLEVEPNPMTMAERGACRVRILVTNQGAETVDPQLYLAELSVAGQASTGLPLAFQNGVMLPHWSALPPGDTARIEREICELFFERPGQYELGFRHGSSSSSVVVRVTP